MLKQLASCLGLIAAMLVFIVCCATVGILIPLGVDLLERSQVQPAMPAVPAVPSTPAPVNPVPAPTPAPEPVCPGPDCPDCPKPDAPKPKPNRRPRGCEAVGLAGAEQAAEQTPVVPMPIEAGFVHDGPVHGGVEVAVDLPADLLKRNISSKGLGCCVFRSTHYQGLNQNVPEVIDLPEKMVKAGIEGGGWPQKFDQVMKRFAPGVKYIQIENGDWPFIELALRTGRMPNITYNPGHMLNIVCLDTKANVGAFRDNNLTGPNELVWGTADAVKAKAGGSHFWAVILLNPRAPMPPRNKLRVAISRPLWKFDAEGLLAPHLGGRYEWRSWPEEETQWPLWRNGQQTGVYSADLDQYVEYLAPGTWGKRYRRPPVELPKAALKALEKQVPPGVSMEALGTMPRYSVCGEECTLEQAKAVLEDDSKKLSLTVIGSKEEGDKVRAELALPENATFRSKVLLQTYIPGTPCAWAVDTKRYGFLPGIYLQEPDGTVIWREDKWEGRKTVEALRKADPTYKPDADPGVKPQPAPNTPDSPTPHADPLGTFAGLAAVCLGIVFALGMLGVSGGLSIHLFFEILE